VFRQWAADADPRLEVAPVQLPGREHRLTEPPCTRLDDLAGRLAEAIQPHLGKPYAIFGHSMGARIGFELAHRLGQAGLSGPVWLFASGCRAPQVPIVERYHQLSEAAFVAKLRALNGTPPEVFATPELLDLVVPILRADFELVETYVYRHRPPLGCPIRVFGGTGDAETGPEQLAAWRVQTRAACPVTLLPGDHFFLHAERPALLATIAADLFGDGG
jgi:medium-chain acyl-[acyl-carrier-protein] hydrolase